MRLALTARLILFCLLLPVVAARGQTLGQVLDATNLVWTTGGAASWIGQGAVTHDGLDAARSGALGDNAESWLQTTVTGPGTLVFWWKVSSEFDYDFLTFEIGGVRHARISGEEDWRQFAAAIASGNQTLRWRYAKDAFTFSGQDRGWLDEVAFFPDVGPPLILTQPAGLTVGCGGTATFVVGVAGGVPRSYQWFRDETNAVAGATNRTLVLPNVQPGDAGSYRVTISNTVSSVTSQSVLLTVTVNGPVSTILLFSDDLPNSPYRTALDALGRPYQRFSTLPAFDAAVRSANPGTSLAVAEVATTGFLPTTLAGFVQAGGRAIYQNWQLGVGSDVGDAFQAARINYLFSPQPLYDWGPVPFFEGLDSPLGSFVDLFDRDGIFLEPRPGGRGVAGFTNVPTLNQTAVVLGNSGRSILNGIQPREILPVGHAAQFVQNEIQFLIDLTTATPPRIFRQPADQAVPEGRLATFQAGAAGTWPWSYQWFFNETNMLAGATNSELRFDRTIFSDAGSYGVLITNQYGAVTSTVATLTFLTPPLITEHPQPVTVVAGENATFTVTVTNTATLPVTYRWRKASRTLTNVLLNSRTCSFTLFNVQTNVTSTNGPGTYWVIVSNAAHPTGLASSLVNLTVVPVMPRPTISTFTRLTNGVFQLRFRGSIGENVAVLVSTNLIDWTVLGAAAEAAPGEYEFTDVDAPTRPARFYQLRQP